jgi:hypothetical protein
VLACTEGNRFGALLLKYLGQRVLDPRKTCHAPFSDGLYVASWLECSKAVHEMRWLVSASCSGNRTMGGCLIGNVSHWPCLHLSMHAVRR